MLVWAELYNNPVPVPSTLLTIAIVAQLKDKSNDHKVKII